MDNGPLTGVETWTGAEARLLRTVALRMSVREFAAFLGLPARTISKWEQAGGARQPRPSMQSVLDAALQRADPAAQLRFRRALDERSAVHSNGSQPLAIAEAWDLEAWADDVERARVHVDRQDFQFASRLMSRWIGRADGKSLDDRALYLKAQSLIVLGHVQRDQGVLVGPQSADPSYRHAMAVFRALGNDRRVAQAELLLTVVKEMSGQLEPSAARYLELADDERLGALDRARARLWVGTALTKGSNLPDDQAAVSIRSIQRAIQEFETLDEPDEWSVSHQKLALANLAVGKLSAASEAIALAIESRRVDSPLQRVRLDTAHAHILCVDKQTRDSGLALLDKTHSTAATFKLAHQVASIERIRDGLDRKPR